jgi:hypothetical protein
MRAAAPAANRWRNRSIRNGSARSADMVVNLAPSGEIR